MGSVTVELSGVRDTVAVVTGLTPGASYIFSVTAENAVSSLDNSGMNVITSTPMITEEGGTSTLLYPADSLSLTVIVSVCM